MWALDILVVDGADSERAPNLLAADDTVPVVIWVKVPVPNLRAADAVALLIERESERLVTKLVAVRAA